MQDQPLYNPEAGKEGENGANPNNGGAANPNPAGNAASSSNNPAQVKVKVNLSQKPLQEDETVKIQSDDEFFSDQTKPTEKDTQNDKEKIDALKNKLSGTQSSSSSSSSNTSAQPSATIPIDKRQAQAEKWVKALDILNRWGCKAFSGQIDNVGFETSEPDKKALAEALADVMQEYNWNPAPLLTLAVTFGAVYGTPWMNAFESRKKIKDLRGGKKKEEIPGRVPNVKPEFDAERGEHRKKRGGQFKG